VLSGFVLSLHFFKKYDEKIIIKQTIKRFPRLFLPVLFTSLIYWFVQKQGYFYNIEVVKITGSEWFSNFWLNQYSLKHLVIKCAYDLMIFNEQTFCNNINTSLWTMPIELKYSFLLFVSILFIRNKILLLSYNILIINVLFFLKDDTFNYFFGFIVGMNIAYFYNINNKLIINNKLALTAVVISLIFATNAFGYMDEIVTRFNFFSFIRITGAGLIIFVILYNNVFQNFLSNKYLLYLGKISFSVYLIHALVLGTVSSKFYVYTINELHFSQNLSYSLVMVLTLSLSVIAGALIDKIIDRPSLILIDWLYKIIDKKIIKKLYI
jgi:peptidoglycan/LPS O-acetylase OafA/YrhL